MVTKSKGTTVYVSAASKEIERAERMIESLRALGLGVVVALDWPKRFREERAKYGAASDATVPPEVMRAIYDEEIQVAGACDVFVLLHPPAPGDTIVAWAELAGARIGAEGRRPVVIVTKGADEGPAVAAVHPLARAFANSILDTDGDALTWLAGFMSARRAA